MIFSIVGCSRQSSSWQQPVPNADIIFQSTMSGPFELNFIQAVGSNHQVLNVDENFVKPIWSRDATIIYGLSDPSTQFPYEDIGYPAYWDIKKGVFKRCEDNLPDYWQIEEENLSTNQKKVLLYDSFEIVLLNMDTCQIQQNIIDFNNQSGEYGVSGFSYYPMTQELVYGRFTVPNESRKYSLIKLNLQTG